MCNRGTLTNFIPRKRKKFINPTTGIKRKANHSVKPVLKKRLRTKGKQ